MSPYVKGYRAAQAGGAIEACPYRPGKAYDDWREGFADAARLAGAPVVRETTLVHFTNMLVQEATRTRKAVARTQGRLDALRELAERQTRAREMARP